MGAGWCGEGVKGRDGEGEREAGGCGGVRGEGEGRGRGEGSGSRCHVCPRTAHDVTPCRSCAARRSMSRPTSGALQPAGGSGAA